MDGLTEGRIVHYVMPSGEHRPAIVVKVWQLSGACDGYINLQVFTDGSNDLLPYNGANDDLNQAIKSGVWWRTSICYSEDKEPGTWHWIEKA